MRVTHHDIATAPTSAVMRDASTLGPGKLRAAALLVTGDAPGQLGASLGEAIAWAEAAAISIRQNGAIAVVAELPVGSDDRQDELLLAADLGALAGITRSLMREWLQLNIRVNCVVTGQVGPGSAERPSVRSAAEVAALLLTPAFVAVNGAVVMADEGGFAQLDTLPML